MKFSSREENLRPNIMSICTQMTIKRIGFSIPTHTWIRRSLNEYEIRIADLSPEIAVESTLLRGFHKDPADQIIVATSRILGLSLVTSDEQILKFPDADSIW
jgi:PIN domain nuclease of toxin-antitoxin system